MQKKSSEGHRPGAFKQQNKQHKHGRHRSKSELRNTNKGKASIKILSKHATKEMGKVTRRNRMMQIRESKREDVLAKKRKVGQYYSPPFLVGIIPLSPNVDPHLILNALKSCESSENSVSEGPLGYTLIKSSRFNKRYTFVIPPMDDYTGFLDLCKVADTVIFVHSLEEEEDDYGRGILSLIFGQGLPSSVHVTYGLQDVPIKKRNLVKKSVQKNLGINFPGEKMHFVDTDTDALMVLRQIGDQKQRSIMQRDCRPYLLAEDFDFISHENNFNEGTLTVTGFLKGKTLDVNALVHISGMGDYQISRIDSLITNPLTNEIEREELIAVPDPCAQVPLQSEIIPDITMEGEQTWPTEEELAEAKAELKAAQIKKRGKKRVPAGMSDYQAAWIVESDGEEGIISDEDNENMDVTGEFEAGDESDNDDGEDEGSDDGTEAMTEGELDDEKYDKKVNFNEDALMLQKFRDQRVDQMFPDEVDTPADRSAFIRFQKYRGLKSFNNSYWDPKENLPYDYLRIFQFSDLKRTRKRIMAEEPDGVTSGLYVKVHISGVKKSQFEDRGMRQPLILVGLLPHENKMSLMNVVIKRYHGFDEPVKSKDRLIFHIGCRCFFACPIFSAHTKGTKFKMERFLPDKGCVIASMFAPITFPPASVLVFRQETDGSHALVATGMVHTIDPDRIITKRVVLSGHPFKINRKSAVVRYMFFNRDDVMCFKAVELRTKHGRRGHIKEPLGTHGHMKCVFDGQLKSEDTVLMNLYKRVYPKWTYDPNVPRPIEVNRY